MWAFLTIGFVSCIWKKFPKREENEPLHLAVIKSYAKLNPKKGRNFYFKKVDDLLLKEENHELKALFGWSEATFKIWFLVWIIDHSTIIREIVLFWSILSMRSTEVFHSQFPVTKTTCKLIRFLFQLRVYRSSWLLKFSMAVCFHSLLFASWFVWMMHSSWAARLRRDGRTSSFWSRWLLLSSLLRMSWSRKSLDTFWMEFISSLPLLAEFLLSQSQFCAASLPSGKIS